MAWTSPITWVNGTLTASALNTEVRDHFNYLRNQGTVNGFTSDTVPHIQAGTTVFTYSASAVSDGGALTVVFPTAFASAPTIQLTLENIVSVSLRASVIPGTITTTQFQCASQDVAGAVRTGTVRFYWFAIG